MSREVASQRRERSGLLLLLFTFALCLRLGAAAALGLADPPPPGSDEQEYDTYAWNVLQGRGYRGMSPDVADQDHLTAYRPPLPSLVWAGLYGVFGRRYEAVRIMNCLLGAGSVLLLFVIACPLYGERTAWMAGLAWAVFPTALFYSAMLGSEPITSFLFLWFVLACLRFASHATWARATGAGVLLGLVLLTHGSKVLMVPLVTVWAAWQFRSTPGSAARAMAIPLVATLVVVPWATRNYRVFGEFIPLSTTGGSMLLQGNNRLVVTEPRLYGYNIWDTRIPEYAEALRAPNDEIERDRVARRLAIEWLRQNRDKWLFLVQAKLRRGLTPFLQPNSPRLYRLGTLLAWGPVLLLSGMAFFPTWWVFLRRRDAGWLVHLTIVNFLLITVIFFGYSRYRYSVEPFCVLLAVVAVQFALTRLRRSRVPLSGSELARAVRLPIVRAGGAMLRRLWGLIRYNRDWPRYLLGRYWNTGAPFTTFRLRNGQTVALKPDVRFTLNEIYLDHVYDIPGVDLATCHSVLDLGANMGVFALYVASRSPAMVHCFEPESTNYEVLQRNLAVNRARAKAYRMALSTSCGTGHLSLEGSSAEYALGRAQGKSEAVECVDWDRLFEVTGIRAFDFVKMDIEGAELEILESTSDECLRRIGALSMEWHHATEKLERLAGRLRGLGFEVSPESVHSTRLLKARQPARGARSRS